MNNVLGNAVSDSVESTPPSVNATMDDIYHVLIAMKAEGVGEENQQAYYGLTEQYLRNRTVGGEFPYTVRDDGAYVVKKIVQYKPKRVTSDAPFVVEM